MTAISRVTLKHTLMTATCHGCGRAWRAAEGTNADELGVVNLRRRIKDHARSTGHEVTFVERRVVEGRICRGG